MKTMEPINDYANLYFECHITIEPVYGDRLLIAASLATMYRFKITDLLMKKREDDTPERSSCDTFMTSRGIKFSNLKQRMLALIKELEYNGFKVWRYKIEDTILDSNKEDVYGVIK